MEEIINIKIKMNQYALNGIIDSYKDFQYNIIKFMNSYEITNINKYIESLSKQISYVKDSILYDNAYKYGYMVGKIFYINNE